MVQGMSTKAEAILEEIKALPPDERVAHWQQYADMTPDQRSVLRSSGWTSNTAARHAGAPTGLAKEAARPLASAAAPPPPGATKPTRPRLPSQPPGPYGP